MTTLVETSLSIAARDFSARQTAELVPPAGFGHKRSYNLKKIMPTTYMHLRPEHDPPAFNSGASKFIVVVDAEVSNEWRNSISDWILDCGCLYMLAWGQDCTAWDDSVDLANLGKFDFGDIPADQSVMTTWHEDEPLDEVFRFSKEWATHPITPLDHTVILHISETGQQDKIIKAYEAA